MAGRAKTVPALQFAKVSVNNKGVEVESFDLENDISCKGPVIHADEEFTFLVNPNELTKAVKSINDDMVAITLDGGSIHIDHESGIMTLPVFTDVSFPTPTEGLLDARKVYEVETSYLWDRLCSAINFVAEDNFRPALNGVFFFKNGASMGVCSTDAHKLYADSLPLGGDSEDFSAILSSSAIKPLLSIIEGDPLVKLFVDDKNFVFKTSFATLTTRIVEGTFPNFKAIIPREGTTSVLLNKDFLSASVRRVGMFANKDTSQIKLDIKGDKVDIHGCDLDVSKQAKESLAITKEGDDLVISAKANFFSTCLSTITSDSVELLFNGATKPILFKDKNKNDKILVLMPMICA